MSAPYPFTLKAIAAKVGPMIDQTETTCRFVGRPDLIVRLESGRPSSWINRLTGRVGGLESLALTLGLPMPPADPSASYYGNRRSNR